MGSKFYVFKFILILSICSFKTGYAKLAIGRDLFEVKSANEYEIIQRNNLLARKDSDIASKKLYAETLKLKSTQIRGIVLLGFLSLFFILMLIAYFSYKKNKRLNRIITNQKNELERINADKDKVFSIIGHDLRSPFNTLKSFTHLIDGNYINQENILKYNKEIKRVLSRTTILLDNLLNWSNSQMQGYKAKMENVSMSNIINIEIDNMVFEAQNKNITIVNNISDELMVFTDANMCSVIIRNLLSNAIKFSNFNGLIEFNAEIIEHQLAINIIDNGVGMEDSLIAQFNSTQIKIVNESSYGTNNEPGTGLGLFLIKNFVKLIKGKVSVKRAHENNGTVFNLLLPLLETKV